MANSAVEQVRQLEVRRLGLIGYDEALALQRELVEERRVDKIPDLLLLLEHPPVITLGARSEIARANVVATDDRLADLGIAVRETGRGGDVTYHGPGQIVAYPIMDLRALVGVGPRLAEHTINSIPLHPGPAVEDMRLKEPSR